MELQLQRDYHEHGTNGKLIHNGKFLCYTIELPWRDNIRLQSCIPEGRYRLKTRVSKRHGLHWILLDVPDRDLILIHPANDAAKELRGCIAPVSKLTGEGKGRGSKVAFRKLMDHVFDNSSLMESKWLLIKKQASINSPIKSNKYETGTDR